MGTPAGKRHADARDQAIAALRATTDAMLDPQALVVAIRDAAGNVTDFTYREVNPAACSYLMLPRAALLGRTLLETFPNVEASGMLASFVRCVQTGEPTVLDDFAYFNEILRAARRYDIRAARAGSDSLSLTWRDVTERYEAVAALKASEEQFRLLAENSSDVVARFRDGLIVWVSPSVDTALGAPPEHWVGRQVREMVVGEDAAILAEILAEADRGMTSVRRLRLYDAAGDRHWVEAHAKTFYDSEGRPDGRTASLRVVDDEVSAEERYRGVLEDSAIATGLTDVDGGFVTVNAALCEFLGYDAKDLLTKGWQDIAVLDDPPQGDLVVIDDLLAGRIGSYQRERGCIRADGRVVWGLLTLFCLRDRSGQPQYLVGQVVDIDEAVRTREALEVVRREQARADALYRGLMEHSVVATAISSLDGRLVAANPAMCEMFGFDRDSLGTTDWLDHIAARHHQANAIVLADLLSGELKQHREVQRFFAVDGRRFWADISSFCMRDDAGEPEYVVSQLIDVTERVTEERRVLAELDNAATYMKSMLPGDLDGPVRVQSRYLPSSQLGGDCFDYAWLDDDHLMVYLLDVSGHGAEPAMLAASLFTLLRAGRDILPSVFEQPDQVLANLNLIQQMEKHDGHYFTMWLGVYQRSTGTLSYASAGHPPAFALTVNGDRAVVTPMSTATPPVGMFADTVFTSASYRVPAGGQVLLYSDGAFELTLDDGSRWSHAEFAGVCSALAAQPDWSVEALTNRLRAMSRGGELSDDCSVVLLSFD